MSKRVISDCTWKSKKIRSIQPPELRPEYAWIMPMFSDNGVAEFDIEVIWAEAYAAARPGWTIEDVEKMMEEFINVGLLKKYDVDGKTYCWLVGSDKNGHLPPPSQRYGELPLPPDYAAPMVKLPPKYQPASQRVGQPYGNPMATLGESYGSSTPGIGLGLGSGFGSGLGTGSGKGSSAKTQTKTLPALQASTNSIDLVCVIIGSRLSIEDKKKCSILPVDQLKYASTSEKWCFKVRSAESPLSYLMKSIKEGWIQEDMLVAPVDSPSTDGPAGSYRIGKEECEECHGNGWILIPGSIGKSKRCECVGK